MTFRNAKNQSTTESRKVHKHHACGEDFPTLYHLRLHRQMIH